MRRTTRDLREVAHGIWHTGKVMVEEKQKEMRRGFERAGRLV